MFSIQTASTALLSMLAATLLVAPASATTMEELSFEEMAYVADLVVEAVTIDNRVERIPGADHLRTVTRLELHHVIKGEAIEGDEVDVLVLGGRLDREETRLESAPIFTPDERVIVFLEQRKGDWRVVGLSQGKLTLVEEPSTARDVLVRVQPPVSLRLAGEGRCRRSPDGPRLRCLPRQGRGGRGLRGRVSPRLQGVCARTPALATALGPEHQPPPDAPELHAWLSALCTLADGLGLQADRQV